MIRDEKRGEVEDEIRLKVDALMREELDLLKIVRYGRNFRPIVVSWRKLSEHKFFRYLFCRPPNVTKASAGKFQRSGRKVRKRPVRRARRRRTRT
jgi:hypothetical protein